MGTKPTERAYLSKVLSFCPALHEFLQQLFQDGSSPTSGGDRI